MLHEPSAGHHGEQGPFDPLRRWNPNHGRLEHFRVSDGGVVLRALPPIAVAAKFAHNAIHLGVFR